MISLFLLKVVPHHFPHRNDNTYGLPLSTAKEAIAFGAKENLDVFKGRMIEGFWSFSAYCRPIR